MFREAHPAWEIGKFPVSGAGPGGRFFLPAPALPWPPLPLASGGGARLYKNIIWLSVRPSLSEVGSEKVG